MLPAQIISSPSEVQARSRYMRESTQAIGAHGPFAAQVPVLLIRAFETHACAEIARTVRNWEVCHVACSPELAWARTADKVAHQRAAVLLAYRAELCEDGDVSGREEAGEFRQGQRRVIDKPDFKLLETTQSSVAHLPVKKPLQAQAISPWKNRGENNAKASQRVIELPARQRDTLTAKDANCMSETLCSRREPDGDRVDMRIEPRTKSQEDLRPHAVLTLPTCAWVGAGLRNRRSVESCGLQMRLLAV
ncbi:hypothetical protein SKAU_G00002590 [Synaphobranchus kaupii]|uniref:Uncharacterized protein n=1 Tax=Synaphobranchus kaupii TaxID=118154 RepID=A0A9Q1JAF3_SYNKA|nr:hypothetical protein SKAU_G00002590 [Synaphobranchus kaupii]